MVWWVGDSASVYPFWAINWQLDMTFGEDQSRTRKDDAAANRAVLRRMSLSLLKNETSEKVGIKNKRLVAA